jgi:single-stranded DNA-specific DHH superfamily exonuclease
MHQRFKHIDSRYQKLLKKAEFIEEDTEKILFFQYGGDLSISADLSNELSYKFPKKIIVVVYVAGAKANISVRGKNVRSLILNSIEELDNATGGGHQDAVGAQVKIEDLERFRENLIKLAE